MARKRQRKRPPLPPPPLWSDCLYYRLERESVGLFRFLLEAEDNLAYMSVVDRWAAVVQVVFCPRQKREVERCLERIAHLVPLTRIPVNSLPPQSPDSL
ncbi:DUF4911 domain-containing protein [Desulfovibrio sp. OttesenSCG-928-I05]|nr:DUF4911 domain-containing protein [Desulfovibrio sp. OttesenSCG-928-I05]